MSNERSFRVILQTLDLETFERLTADIDPPFLDRGPAAAPPTGLAARSTPQGEKP